MSEADDLTALARAGLEIGWDPFGYTAPHGQAYPWQWLWDSCFHALIWDRLGDDRAPVELGSVFAHQDPDGFVPHLGHQRDPSVAPIWWGRPTSSCLTQPPVFGHTCAALAAAGHDVGPLAERSASGLRWLLRERRHPTGLVVACHPWETGCDDTPRWDGWSAVDGVFDRARWRLAKIDLTSHARRTVHGAVSRNPAFEVAAASFNAVVAWSCAELGGLTGDDELRGAASELTEALDDRWDDGGATWLDTPVTTPPGPPSHGVRVVEALLPLLLDVDPAHAAAAAAQLTDPDAFAAPFGLVQVHRDEPTCEPDRYWRGAAWPPLHHLLWLGLRHHGFMLAADEVAAAARRGCLASGASEHLDARTGAATGATPCGWGGLPLLTTRPAGSGRAPG